MQKKNAKNSLIVALLITVLFFIPSLALSADVGNIDGLWMCAAPGAESQLMMVREDQGLVLITALDLTDMSWRAFYGFISGNSVQLNLLVSQDITASAGNITFSSATSAVLVITVCQPPEACPLPLNMEIPYIKIF